MIWLYENKVVDVGVVKFVIVVFDGCDGMLQYVQQVVELKILLIFDLGQGMLMFDGNDFKNFIDLVIYVVVNDYEVELLMVCIGLLLVQIVECVMVLVVICGELGVDIFVDGKYYVIFCVKVDKIVDLIGCGDVFCVGMLFGLIEGYDWEIIGCLVSLMGFIKIVL